jgi:hypothetical protein
MFRIEGINEKIRARVHAIRDVCRGGRAIWRVAYAAMIWSCWLVLAGFAPGDGCGGSGPGNPPGTLSLSWSITGPDGKPTTCAAVNARAVAVRIRSRATTDVVATAFPCGNSPVSAQAPAGVYDITFALNAADGTRLATAPDQTSIVVVSGKVKALTPLTFAAATGGRLVASLTAPPATSNCKSVASGGAGITGVSIAVEHVRDRSGCAPVTFIRTRGSTQVGTYLANDCPDPSVTSCIESDETLTVQSMDAGSYLIHVVGKLGPLDCWRTDETFDVPAAGKTVTHPLHLTHQNTPGC